MKRVLLTGATGFVGANLARRLLREGHEVHLLVREAHDPWRIEGIRADVELRVVDLAGPVSLAAAVREIRPEWVFHLAAYGAYASQRDVDLAVRTNVAATVHLVDACSEVGFEAFVNTGSSSEYGFADHAPSEEGPIAPNSLYAVTKAAATLYCQHVARRDGRRIVTLRLYSVYGPWEEPTRLVPQLVLEGLEGRLPPLVSPGVARDFVLVDDACEAYLRAAAGPVPPAGAVYNVGTGTQTTLRELVALARQLLPIAVEPEWGSMPDRAWDTTVWTADPRRIRDELGWQPAHDLAAGLRRTIDWLGEPVHHALYRDRLGRGRGAAEGTDRAPFTRILAPADGSNARERPTPTSVVGGGSTDVPAWQVFDRDAEMHSGYLYTATEQLSSRLATTRSRDLLLSTARFAGRSVLDLGCGDGFYTMQLWDMGRPRELTGIDAAPHAIEVARTKKGERPIRFEVGDSHRVNFADDSFDVVLLQSVLHHDDDATATLAEAFRLAPEVVIHEPNGNNPGLKIIEKISPYHRRHHERSYSARRMRQWIENARGHVVALRFAGFVPMFAPDWVARTMKRLEPRIENEPALARFACAVYVIVAARR